MGFVKQWIRQKLCDHRWIVKTNHDRAIDLECAFCGKGLHLPKAKFKVIKEE